MKKTFIIAVSGGVDSVVLLHMLAHVKPPTVTYVIAHVNHGIRMESSVDEHFVQELAQTYGYDYESIELHLGANASEEVARNKRYEFLYDVMRKFKAEVIITAHHQDDVLETMTLNLLRGTGYRGLVGYTRPHIIRPLINKTKAEILNYASINHLNWREDSSNQDTRYMRNYIRKHMIPRIKERTEWFALRASVAEKQIEIDDLCKKLLVQTLYKGELVRARFVILPYTVQKELIAQWLRLSGVAYDRNVIEKTVRAIKVFAVGKQFAISKDVFIVCGKKTIVLKRP